MRRWSALLAVVSALVTVTACSDAAAPRRGIAAATGAELVALARQEGRVVWYTGSLAPAVESVRKAFEQAYGIDVVVPERLSSAALAQRIDGDVRATGGIGADVVLTTDLALSDHLGREGYSVPLPAGMFPGLRPEFVRESAVGCGVVVPIVAYNTAVVGDQPIDSWDDLLAPRLAGKIMVTDPRGSSAWAQLFAGLRDDPRRGDDYLKALRAQNFQPVASSLVGAEQLVAGQGGVLVAGIPALFTKAIAQGRPIRMWFPADPAPVAFDMCLISQNAEHPNAARLFLEWLMSPEGQAAMTIPDQIASPLGDIPGAAVPLPAGFTGPPPPAKVQQDLPGILQLLGFS